MHQDMTTLGHPRRDSASTASEWSKNRKYAVIIDAGSSGSRMQVYSWLDPKTERAERLRTGQDLKELPKVEKGTWPESGKDWQLKVEPGISSFHDHPKDLPQYLKTLFAHAVDVIPPQALASTPVYLLATAGMRLLPDAEQHAILTTTCKYIRTHTPFIVGDAQCTEHVKVITGEEEGMLGWIAINYLMDGFKYRPNDPLKHEIGLPTGTHGRTTYGFLDMGGASMQIAFEPKEIQPADDNIFPVKLRMLDGTDVVHNVFTVTFLGFGANQARKTYIDKLISNATSSARPPSLPASTSTSSAVPDPCLPPGLSIAAPASSSSSKHSLLGSGSFSSCMAAISPLLEKDAACSRPPCLFHGVHVPHIDFSVNHFIGVSEYWYSSNDVFGLGGLYDFPKFQKAAEDFCATPWKDLSKSLKDGKIWGKQVTEDRLQNQCFKSAWLATVLHDGIGLPRIVDAGGEGDGNSHADTAQDKADEKNLFQSVNDVHGLSVSWTLGKAVLESSRDVEPINGSEGKGKNDAASPGIGKGAAPNFNTTRGQATYAILGLVGLFLVYLCWARSRRSRSSAGASVATGGSPGLGSPRAGGGGSGLLDRLAHALRNIISLKDVQSGRGDYMLANMEEGVDDDPNEDEDSNGKLTPRNHVGLNGFGLGSSVGLSPGVSLSRPPSRSSGNATVGITSSVWPQASLSRPPSRGPSPGLVPWTGLASGSITSPAPFSSMSGSWHASTNSGGSSTGGPGGLTSPTLTDGRRQSGGSLPRMSMSSASGNAVAAVASSSLSRVNSFTSLSNGGHGMTASGALTPRASARRAGAVDYWSSGASNSGTLLNT
ncbi:hypothetical protein V8E36_001232 [Tilletia maclaganii]